MVNLWVDHMIIMGMIAQPLVNTSSGWVNVAARFCLPFWDVKGKGFRFLTDIHFYLRGLRNEDPDEL